MSKKQAIVDQMKPEPIDLPVIDRLETVRSLPEVDGGESTQQVTGGIEHFKGVDGRTMDVVVFKGELYQKEHVKALAEGK